MDNIVDLNSESFRFNSKKFNFLKNDSQWSLRLRHSEIDTEDLTSLKLTNINHPDFLNQTIETNDNFIHFSYVIDEEGISFDEIKTWSNAEKLRICLNVLKLRECLDLPIDFFLHPINIFITKNGIPKIAYRELAEISSPYSLTENEFLLQWKTFVAYLFTDEDYMSLYKGALGVVKLPAFVRNVISYGTLSKSEEKMRKLYGQIKAEEDKKYKRLPVRRYKNYKRASIILGLLSVVLLVAVLFFALFAVPVQRNIISAGNAFYKGEYRKVINNLEPIKNVYLPEEQKFELAFSYLQEQGFSDEEQIAYNLQIVVEKSPLLTDYWIQIGTGDYDLALDTAKRLEDNHLKLYALDLAIEEAKMDPELSGIERDSRLSHLEGEHNKYSDELKALDEAEQEEGSEENSENSQEENSENSQEENSESSQEENSEGSSRGEN